MCMSIVPWKHFLSSPPPPPPPQHFVQPVFVYWFTDVRYIVSPFNQERDVAPWSERSLMTRWVVVSVLGGPIELFLVLPSAL